MFSTAHAADLVLDVCEALANAHENGVVHGQLGLRCVRLTMSRENGPREVEIFTLTAEGDSEIAQRAAPFMAPEQRDLTRLIDGRADIFSLGAILYATIVGTGLPVAPVRVPAESMPASLASVVESCLATDPARRPQDVDELAEKIASFASWPPGRFSRLAERRERKASAERARVALAARGLGNMPAVLDKLDDAALARARRESIPETATMSSVLDLPASEAALDRLMNVVYEGTEAARVERTAKLPALVDFDDDDDDEVRPPEPSVHERVTAMAMFEAPLRTVPMVMAPPLAPAPAAAPAPASRGILPVVALVVAAFSISVGVGYFGYTMSSGPARAEEPAPIAPPRAAQPVAVPAVAASPTPAVPVVSPSSLPEAAPITPGSLPDAKR